MRAVVLRTYGGPEVLEIQNVPEPDFGPDEILVSVAYTALNRADLLQRMGRYGPPQGQQRIGVTGEWATAPQQPNPDMAGAGGPGGDPTQAGIRGEGTARAEDSGGGTASARSLGGDPTQAGIRGEDTARAADSGEGTAPAQDSAADSAGAGGPGGDPAGHSAAGPQGGDVPLAQAQRRVDYEIPGLEFAGTVVAVGSRVTFWKPGDKVFGLLAGGGYAEKVAIHEAMALPVPDNMTLAEAGGIAEVFLTAFDALVQRASFRSGEKVLVHAGGSGVGTAAIQIVRALGGTAFATVGTPEKARGVEALGARAIQYKTEDFVERIAEATDGAGVDIVLDFVGSPYLARNMHVIGELGRIVVIGLMGGTKAEIDLALLQRKRLTITGTVLRSRPFTEKLALTAAFARHILPLFAEGRIKPIIDSEFALEDVADAHRYMAANKNFGKILLRVGGG